ncbi:unnamed protein product [Ranitomeya imitator]|uniref:MADF domain-containing protein n=1 Tax=Ranitomeya imitator TaxID=111125 RepID=A0ABN9L2U1_9NEOB|nr:unnamed protein product [Ranitomeya imitator]
MPSVVTAWEVACYITKGDAFTLQKETPSAAFRNINCDSTPLQSLMSANDQDCVRTLIDMYRSLPCLWKIKSADYSNCYKKKAAYEKLVAIYKEHHPTETVDENIVRKKIQALRTVYKKEVNKVKKSMKSGAGTDDVYVPKLWYYDLLAFIRDQEIPRPCQTVTSLCAPSAEEILPESPDEHVPPQQVETTEGNDDQTPQSSISPCLEELTRPQRPSRKRKATAWHTCGSPGTGQQHYDLACHNPAHWIPILHCGTVKQNGRYPANARGEINV